MTSDESHSPAGKRRETRRIEDYSPSDEFLKTLDRQLLLAYFVETMLPLSEEDQERFEADVEENEVVQGLRTRLFDALDRDAEKRIEEVSR